MKTLLPWTLLLAVITGLAGCSSTNDRGVIIDHGGWFGSATPAILPVVATSPAPADSVASPAIALIPTPAKS